MCKFYYTWDLWFVIINGLLWSFELVYSKYFLSKLMVNCGSLLSFNECVSPDES